MSTKNDDQIVRIDLTQQQKDQVKTVTDKNAEAIELTVKELEARITQAADRALAPFAPSSHFLRTPLVPRKRPG